MKECCSLTQFAKNPSPYLYIHSYVVPKEVARVFSSPRQKSKTKRTLNFYVHNRNSAHFVSTVHCKNKKIKNSKLFYKKIFVLSFYFKMCHLLFLCNYL